MFILATAVMAWILKTKCDIIWKDVVPAAYLIALFADILVLVLFILSKWGLPK